MKVIVVTAAMLLSMGIANGQKKPAAANTSIGGVSVEQIKKLAADDGPRLVEIFKDLHANPELPFMETRTAAIVAKELTAYGYNVQTGIGGTGVVGILKNGDGPVVMYRADMDCNSVEEATGLPYASKKRMKNPDGIDVPVMHACGHDAHVTWMLGVAKNMIQLKDKWKGTLVMVSQPAEEIGFGADSMASEMYKKGVPVPTCLLGMHSGPAPVGMYLNRPGDRMAGADQLDVTFYGVGGHGSTPEQTKDPVVMAANAIIQYQTIVSRNLNPQRPAVVTVGAVEAGIDNNVIPASATLKLNLRWYSLADRKLLLDRILSINEGIALGNNMPKELYPTVKYKQSLGPVKNDEALTAKINTALEKITGPGRNLDLPPVMGSEDVQQLVRDYPNVPYNYFIIGIANHQVFEKAAKEGKQFPFSNHNPDYEVDLTSIPWGTSMGLAAVLEAFKK
ncbi:MAG: hypothetical protein RL172_1989 [Bacteroidota bacterium]|jgi:amidohydrolase